MINKEQVINAITNDNKTIRKYAMDYFCVNEMTDVQVTTQILDALDNTDDRFEMIEYLSNIENASKNEKILERINGKYYFDSELDSLVNGIIAFADVELLAKRNDIRPKIKVFKNRVKERREYYNTDFDELWKLYWEIDFMHPEFENMAIILKILSERKDFNYEKFHNEINIPARAGNEEAKDYDICELAGYLKDEYMIDYLFSKLYYAEDYISEVAAKSLSKIGTEKVITNIKENYSEMPYNIKLSFITILEEIKIEKSEELLLKLYKTEENETLKSLMIGGLVKHFSKDIIPYLFKEVETNVNYDAIEWLYVIHTVNKITHPKLKEWEENVVEKEELIRKNRVDDYNQENFSPVKAITSEDNNIKIGRNDPCPCGSGKKYKKCCMNK